jgi:ribose transport system permease protein
MGAASRRVREDADGGKRPMSLSSDSAASSEVIARRRPVQMRFAAIWLALVALLALGGVIAPRSLLPSTILAVIPLAAFLTITAAGEALVLMSRSIDLSIPAIVTLASTILLGVSGGRNEEIFVAVIAALAFAALIGLINGLLVAVLKLNALIVTLAIAGITAGATLWYRESLPQESRVPEMLADWGSSRYLGLNVSVWVAALLVIVLTVILRKTTVGRRFSAVGANPRSAWIAGIGVTGYQIAAFTIAGLLYGAAGILLSAFIRNPTLNVGDPYLLAPIAAAVLGGTAISGGIGSLVAVAGAALFLTHLGQMLKMLGLASSLQFIIQGAAIALGMTLAEFKLSRLRAIRGVWRARAPLNFGRSERALLLVVILGAIVIWSRLTTETWNDWLYRYQILVVGILALVVAAILFEALTRQADQAAAAERQRRERADTAARAMLPGAINALSDYAAKSTRALLAMLPENPIQQKVSKWLDADLTIPSSVFEAFQTAIATADIDTARKLADVLAALQVQNARLRRLADESGTRPVWRLEVCQRVMDAAELYAGAAAVLDYARRARETVDLDLSPREIAAALRGCRIIDNPDFASMVAGWTLALSIYGSQAP